MPNNITGTLTYHPTITLPSDGDAGSAASVDSPFQAYADDAAYLLDLAASLPAMNWPGGLQSFGSGVVGLKMLQDPAFGRWFGFKATGDQMYVTYDPFFATGAAIGAGAFTGGANVLAAGLNPSTGQVFVYGLGNIAIFSPSAGTWTANSGPGGLSAGNGITYFNNQWVFWGNVGGVISPFYSQPAGTSYTAGAGTTCAAASANTFHAKSSTALLVFSDGDNANFTRTTDGINWTQLPVPWSSGGSPKVVGAGYSPASVDGVGSFWVCISNGSSFYNIYRNTSDGTNTWLNWQFSIVTGVTSFAVLGTTFAAIATGTKLNAQYRLVATDQLSASPTAPWVVAPLTALSSAGFVRAGAMGFHYADGTHAAISGQSGWATGLTL